MKRSYFVKFNPKLNMITGCDRATIILSKLEYWFSKQPGGFYKFIEPCSHRLYRRGDSWSEELGCDRKKFSRAWNKIGIKHKSRLAFEAAEDKFDGKLYASYYDRHTNQMYFVRNHDLANETLKEFYKIKKPEAKKGGDLSQNLSNSLPTDPLGTGHNVSSYNDAKKTPSELFKNNSHASTEIIQKMLELWIAIVEEGKKRIDLNDNQLIAFLKKAFKDKFHSSLEKWKEYCIKIAHSKFLMGEKTSFRATLDWALKFESIRKVLSGDYYNIGDRERKLTPEELEEIERQQAEQRKAQELEKQKALQAMEVEIRDLDESVSLVAFRLKWLQRYGVNTYKATMQLCALRVGNDERTLVIEPSGKIHASDITKLWNDELLIDTLFCRANVYQSIKLLSDEPFIIDRWFGDISQNDEEIQPPEITNDYILNVLEEPNDRATSTETKQLCNALRELIPSKQFPSWLSNIQVQEITEDGVLIAILENQFIADYAKIRFSEEVLRASRELWPYVRALNIQAQQQADEVSIMFDSSMQSKRPKGEKSLPTLEGAIQALLSVCSGSNFVSAEA